MTTTTFWITPHGTLGASLVSALLLDIHPGATIRPGSGDDFDYSAGVRVTNDVTGRWMFVATGHEPGESVSEALAMGACSVVSIESQREDFHHAVDALLSLDGSYVPLPLLRWLAGTALASSADRSRAGGPPVRLTSREREILSLVSRGLTNTEIADSLTISTNTVRSHLHALAVKLEATSRMKIVTRARDLGFAEAAGILRSIPPQRIPA